MTASAPAIEGGGVRIRTYWKGLGARSVLVYLAFLLHCGDELTDGLIRKSSLRRLLAEAGATRRHLGELERAALIVPVDEGWLIPGYLDWNPSRAWWDAKRARDARRQRQWRAARLGGIDS